MASNVKYSTSVEEMQDLVKSSSRILAVCGAGLSVASGLPTFRGDGGLWRNHEPTSLATSDAFEEDPALVWLFYAWRRHLALTAKPNGGHYALAELAKKKAEVLVLSQNVDGESYLLSTLSLTLAWASHSPCGAGLHLRAGHPDDKLRMLHGSLFDIKCFDDKECGYVERGNFKDPLCPALEAASAVSTPSDQGLPLLDPKVPVPKIDVKDLPQCPKCKIALLRPGVVWFGEMLDNAMMTGIDTWLFAKRIDLVLIIGTSGLVSPANGYMRVARAQGARVAILNPDPETAKVLKTGDFWFQDDAAKVLPQLFAKVVDDAAEVAT